MCSYLGFETTHNQKKDSKPHHNCQKLDINANDIFV